MTGYIAVRANYTGWRLYGESGVAYSVSSTVAHPSPDADPVAIAAGLYVRESILGAVALACVRSRRGGPSRILEVEVDPGDILYGPFSSSTEGYRITDWPTYRVAQLEVVAELSAAAIKAEVDSEPWLGETPPPDPARWIGRHEGHVDYGFIRHVIVGGLEV